MKEVALDTETTGLEVAHNHRIIEIGCVELVSGRRSGKVFHAYINPSRAVSPEAVKVTDSKMIFCAISRLSLKSLRIFSALSKMRA